MWVVHQTEAHPHIHTYIRAYVFDICDLRLSEQLHAMQTSETISLVKMELVFDVSETVSVSIIRGDVMSDVFIAKVCSRLPSSDHIIWV